LFNVLRGTRFIHADGKEATILSPFAASVQAWKNLIQVQERPAGNASGSQHLFEPLSAASRNSLERFKEKFAVLARKYSGVHAAAVVSSDWIVNEAGDSAGVARGEWRTVLGTDPLAGPWWIKIGEECLEVCLHDKAQGIHGIEEFQQGVTEFKDLAQQAARCLPELPEWSRPLLSPSDAPLVAHWLGFLFDLAWKHKRPEMMAPEIAGPGKYRHAKLSVAIFEASVIGIDMLLQTNPQANETAATGKQPSSFNSSMTALDPDAESILRQVQADRREQEARHQAYLEQRKPWHQLKDAFHSVYSFAKQDYEKNEIRRSATADEFYQAWAERLAALGLLLRERGFVELLEREFNPESLEGQWGRRVLLTACHRPTEIGQLQGMLQTSGQEPRLHSVREWLREAGDLLLRATQPVNPVPPDTADDTETVQEESLSYNLDEQEWWTTPLPSIKEVATEELQALADEIDVVIITAVDVEREAVLRRLAPYPPKRRVLKGFIGPETYFLGKFGAFKVVVTKCQMGSLDPGSATLATEQAQRIWRPRAIIMVGIAFGQNPSKQKMADVLVASKIISYEQQRVSGQLVDRGSIPPSNPTLLNRFDNPVGWTFFHPDGSKSNCRIGPILSGEKLVDDPKFKADLLKRFPQAIGGDMEGVGLCAAAIRSGVPWILVKAICDWADGKKHKKHQPLAAAAAVSLVHHVLSQENVLHGLEKGKAM
jgi:nucleoside phosphorylase